MSSDLLQPPVYPPTIETVASAHDSNPAGDIFGGWMLAQMDLAGGARAFAHVGSRVVTAGVDQVSFIKPIFVGATVRFYTEIERIGRTSIAIRVHVWATRPPEGAIEKVTEALYTFVAVDSQFKPIPIQKDAA